MSEDKNTVNRIVWGEVFSFPHIFKSFKMAVHPSKLVLALAALVLIGLGGVVLDAVWGLWGGTVADQEILMHAQTPPAAFETRIEEFRDDDAKLQAAAQLLAAVKNERGYLRAYAGAAGLKGHARQAFSELLNEYNQKDASWKESAPANSQHIYDAARRDDGDWDDLLDDAEDLLDDEIDVIDDLLSDLKDRTEALLAKDPSLKEKTDLANAKEQMDEDLEASRRGITLRKLAFEKQADGIRGHGLFESFAAYQADCWHAAVQSLWNLNLRGGLCAYQALVEQRGIPAAAATVETGLPAPQTLRMPNEQNGFLYYVLMSAEGVRWMILQHGVYAAIFLLWCLAVLSLFGGAVYRIAALHFAREEKISILQALQFSRQKFFSFFSAPLVPAIVILFTGGLLALGGLVGAIPVVGTLLMAVLFGLAILLGVAVAFMLVGLLAGWPLMYPTIAAEGSDSFDAISRSFSYVFARPFRTILYGAIAAIYGAVTYLFVRLFAFLTLCSVHYFVKWGVIGGGSRLDETADKLDVLWNRPTFWNLQQPNWAAMGGWEWICGAILWVWVAIVVGLVAAYMLTYFASSTTAIYYILRRRVDATDLDDVYVEEEEDLAPSVPAEEPAAEEPVEKKEEEPVAETEEEKDE